MNWISKLLGGRRSATQELIDALENRYELSVRAESIDTENRTAIAVAATESRVEVFDFERMEVVEEILVADGGTFPERIPLLDSHDRSSIDKVFGSAVNPQREGTNWLLRMEFDDDEASRTAFKKVQSRSITDVSIGYRVLEAEYISPRKTKRIGGRSYTAGDVALKVATSWQARELSLTPIGADRQAKIRSLIKLQPTQETNETSERDFAFSTLVEDLIDDNELNRSDVEAAFESASGLERSEVVSILNGETPVGENVDLLAAILETDAESLTLA